MKTRILLCIALAALWTVPTVSASEGGVTIQRVITNTRSELGQLATSSKAKEIAELMKTFDTQYQTWTQTCGGQDFDPESAGEGCRQMAAQMRETGISLYGKLADYLPDVAARYEQGARASSRILQQQLGERTPADLYRETFNGVAEAPRLGNLSPGDRDSPFDLEMSDFPDPTEEMFTVLAGLVPDLGREIPEAVRAGNTKVSMMKKGRQARYLTDRFAKAKLALEAKREYGEIIFNTTKAVSAMAKILGIQYTGTRLHAVPNQKVLEYYRNRSRPAATEAGNPPNSPAKPVLGGFESRS